jgi:acetyl esterase/lipase
MTTRLQRRKGRFILQLAGCLFGLLIVSTTAAPPPAPSQANVSYGPDAHQLLDFYLPPDGAGPFPVVIWYGGLFAAHKGCPGLQPFFAAHCALVAVEVRSLADARAAKPPPAAPIAWPMLDARRALQFVRLHAAQWHLDPDRIATAGSSQGTLPALYLACAGEKANPHSADPVERVSTRVTCVGAWRSQPSIDPKQMQAWVPGVEWGSQAFGCTFNQALQRRDELMPIIAEWSPDHLLHRGTPPIYFQNNWGLTPPAGVKLAGYLVHSPLWGLGFQKLAESRGVTCYVDYPGHPTEKYKDMWDFLVQELTAPKP